MEKIKVFEYEGQHIEFDLSKINMMVNATEMAKLFGKEVAHFMENDSTKRFVESCFKTRNSEFLGVKNLSDLYISKQKSGTWMHRVLALKFAAWLDSDFELWVYYTIDKIMFGTMREDAFNKSNAEKEREKLHQKLLNENPDYARMMNLDDKAREMGTKIKKQMRSQLTLMFEENEN